MLHISTAVTCLLIAQVSTEGVIHQSFPQEVRTAYIPGEGLPAKTSDGERLADFPAIAIAPDGKVVASIVTGLGNIGVIEFSDDSWSVLEPFVDHVTESRQHSFAASASGRTYFGESGLITAVALPPEGGDICATGKDVWERREESVLVFASPDPVLALAAGPRGAMAVGTANALYVRSAADAKFEPVYPADERYSWAPRGVSALAYDTRGRLWFGSGQGVGVHDSGRWRLYTGDEGLPYNRFTCAAPGEAGVIWFGTERGAIRFDGERWAYRASLRWLTDDRVNGIAVQPDGTAWIATPKGISRIERTDMTLEKKAEYFIDQVETRHNRDGYIADWALTKRGDVTSATPKISDNDGLYTASYGAAMAFRYATTGDPQAKELARRCFKACKLLVDIVPESMKGFPARVLIPIDWHEPVNEQYGDEYNRRKREGDPFWKLITPRFPTSEDGKYMWKCDTSSDELSGHYFFYAIYYDLVAETEEEKAPVREVVRDISDHIIRNGFNLVDHDGLPTRWGRFGPDYLETVFGWEQSGLNSLMVLAFMSVAEHVTGDPKYAATANMLREKHKYHINAMISRPTFPPENVVPWDNNLALECFYPLMQYENDPELLLMYRLSLEHCWLFISKQKNSLWNIIYGTAAQRFTELASKGFFDGAFPEAGPYSKYFVARLERYDQALSDSLDSLRGMPLELIGWEMNNSHRPDVHLDTTPGQEPGFGWSKLDTKAIPIEERSHVRQDRDSFKIDSSEDDGYAEHEGTFYLLPYYMARYHGFIE